MRLEDLLTQRNFLFFSGLMALFSLACAFTAQYFFDIAPCVLCLYERYIYGGILLCGIVAAINFYPQLVYKLSGVILVGGIALAIYHMGVERHWWQGTAACHGIAAKAKSIEELRTLLYAKPMGRCDQASWSILGISATYINLLWFVGFLGLWEVVRRKNK
ncbi:disulfide bond formation protein B [Candidatus Odyssella acanthamoebae]|uniref:disulfide bond formation protein B n=1 Tax=Candidatus Odyssella acanthamoebae TaxID=91604 RepID=UPI00068B67FD|nr:disulfide bond formation protein B [Candidatus Paracaedibacter acanthamoebae]